MTALSWTRRRAESFDALLEGGRADLDGVDAQTAELLELVGALRSVPAAEARPEFVSDLRGRLMLAAESELTPATGRERDVARLTIKPARTHRERRVGIALGAVAILGATTSMAVASQSAIPGDALYPLKRAIENTEAGFSLGDDAKGQTILDNASGRLDEVDQLTSQAEPDAGLVAQTLDTFSDQAAEAGDLLIADYQDHGDEQSIQQVHEFAADSLATLSSLEASIPASAHDALLNAAQTVLHLDSLAAQVCPGCGEPILEVPGQLLAGATTGAGPTTDTLAGGQLSGTDASESAKPGHTQNGGKDNGRPSAVNPPASPVAVPSTEPSSSSTEGSDDLGNGLPSIGTNTSGGNQGGHGGPGGPGGPGKDKDKPVDLEPVTGAVTDTVNQVVEGVTDLLSGGQSGK